MQDIDINDEGTIASRPWNKGKLIGAKLRLRPKHVWAVRAKLQLEGRLRDLTLFNLAIDSKLWGRHLVSIRVEDVAPPRLRSGPGDRLPEKVWPASEVPAHRTDQGEP